MDFTFSKEECEGSLKSPSLLFVEHVSPSCTDGRNLDITTTISKSLSPPSGSKKWQDLFSSNRNTESCTKLKNFSLNHLTKTCSI